MGKARTEYRPLSICAAGADSIVLCLGESAAMSGEAASRTDLGLPGRQRALAEAVLDLGKPVVVTLSRAVRSRCHGCSSGPTRCLRPGSWAARPDTQSPTF